jgi:hypothetical protein
MDHYLRNSALYIMSNNFENCTKEEIAVYQNNYILFLAMITQLSALTKKQKISFLRHLKAQHEEAIK